MGTEPVVKRLGDSWWVIWASRNLTFEFSRLAESKDTVTAEVTVVSQTSGLLHWARINLASTQARNALARALEDALPDGTPWARLVQSACHDLAKQLRTPEAVQVLRREEPTMARWWIPEWMPVLQTSILYGDGGTGKSLIALALAAAATEGRALGYWAPGPASCVLYLDWEAERRDHAERLWQLTGHESDRILHLRCVRALTELISEVRSVVDRKGVDLVIVDSLGAACGSEPESADSAIRTLMALRSLERCTRLVLAHVSKAGADETRTSPYGSVYVKNLARSTIEARRRERDEDDGTLTVDLYHRKTNYGRYARSWGLQFEWGIDGAITTSGVLADISRTSIPNQILKALPVEPASKTVPELSEDIRAKADTVRTKLNELEANGKVIRLSTVSGGRGNLTQWARPLRNRTGE